MGYSGLQHEVEVYFPACASKLEIDLKEEANEDSANFLLR